MKNVDVDIYLNHFKTFFDKNPNDLTELLGDVMVEDFYKKVEEQCYKNHDNGDEITLSQKQLIDIVVKLKKGDVKIALTNGVFQQTKFGLISLNQIWKLEKQFVILTHR